MRKLYIQVLDKVATYYKRGGNVVCGNSDYEIEFSFDLEWDAYENKVARFIWGGKYFDQPFVGKVCPVPVLRDTDTLTVGVYAGELSTTTPAVIPCQKSILCSGETTRTEDEPVYISAAIEAAEEAKQAAEEAKRAAGGGQNFANALKGSATGSAVRIDDASPIEHNMAVKVRSKNLFDNDTSKIAEVNYTSSSGGVGSKNGYILHLPVGSYTMHAETIDEATKESNYYIYYTINSASGAYKLTGDIVKLQKYSDAKFDFADGDVLYLYNGSNNTLSDTKNVFGLFNIQIEQGSTATEYTPYVDVSAVTVHRYGKNIVDTRAENWVKVEGYTDAPSKGIHIPVKDGETFTISWDKSSDEIPYFFTRITHKSDGTFSVGYLTDTIERNKTLTTTAKDGNEYYLAVLGSDTVNVKQWLSKFAYIQVEMGNATAYEPYIATTEYTPNADGTVEGVTSLSPTTTLMTDTEGVVIDVEYNRDLNKAFAELASIVNTLVGG